MLVCRCAHYELAKPGSIAYPLLGMQMAALSPEHYYQVTFYLPLEFTPPN